MTSEKSAASRRALYAGLFLVSGAAGLIDQIVWLRYLSLVFGNTTLATATLLAVFLGGLGAGALYFSRRATAGRPLFRYAVMELGIGAFALASPHVFELINHGYVAAYRAVGDELWIFAPMRLLLAAICLLPPTFLMGGTLPVLLQAFRSEPGREGRDTALLYGANTLGAVLGVALAGFVTIRLFGLEASLLLAAALNLAVALCAVVASRAVAADAASRTPPARAEFAPNPDRGDRQQRFLLGIAAAMGATSIACEVLWTRVLVFYLGSSVYAFSLMLLLFLLGVSAGSLTAGRVVDRWKRPLVALALLELALALLALASIALFTTMNARQLALSTALEPQAFSMVVLAQILAVAPVMLPPTFVMGLTFPLLVRAYSRDAAQLGADVGRVYGANTIGSIAGALGAGFLLVPWIGSQSSLLFVGGMNAAIALALLRRPEGAALASAGQPTHSRRTAAALAAGTMVLLALAAFWLPRDRVILSAGIFAEDRPGDLVYFDEDASAAVAVRSKLEEGRPWLSLELNGVNVAGTSPDLYAVQKMQGHLPLLLGGRSGARVVHIGFGSGGTAHAVSRHDVSEIRIVEISPAVLAASDRYFSDINLGVLADPRVRVEINDGRNFLMATPEKFDAVLSDSIHPRYAGNGSLYSKEYFELLERRLEPGGVVSMWLPMYALTPSNFAMILRAFVDVFPQTAVWYEPSALNSFTVVTARKEASPWDAESLARGMAQPPVREALADIGIESVSDLLSGVLLSGSELAAFLADSPPHVDDLPAIEYESGTLSAPNWSWLQTFTRMVALRSPTAPADVLAALPAAERAEFSDRWIRRGELLAEHRDFLKARVTRWN